MKLRNSLVMLLSLGLTAGFVGCSDNDDDYDVNPSKVPQEVKTSFESMFPNARVVDWEKIVPWYVADFDDNTFDKDAWFTDGGVWVMTQTDYGSITTFLPVEVQNAFQQSQYSSWIVDDVDMYERVADTFYTIEVETAGPGDVTLFYSPDGSLINTVLTDYPDITPNTVIEAL